MSFPFQKPRLFRSGRLRCSRGGVALVITLAFLVLVTFLAVAFFSKTLSNRQIEDSSGEIVESDLLARSALETVLADLKAEMRAGSTLFTANGTTVFQPADSAMLPRRVLVSGISSTNADFSSLFKQSAGRFFPNTAPTNQNSVTPLIQGTTGVPTSRTSADGRLVTGARWSSPKLLFGNATFSDSQVPQWILLTRSGVPASQSWSTPLRDAAQSNQSFVIGRFAYNLYEVGGLLDANAAGHVSGLSASERGLKGGIGLAAIGGIPGVTDADRFIKNWRNKASGLTVSDYLAYLGLSGNSTNAFYNLGPGGGFMKPAIAAAGDPADSLFIGRQDLIKLAQDGDKGITAQALPYLTHFTRELSGPSWGPTTPTGSSIDYASEANTAGKNNRYLPNYRSDREIERLDGTIGQAGDPFLVRRFPLSYLAWLRDADPNTAAFDEGPELAADRARIAARRAANGKTEGTDISNVTGTAANLIRRVFGLGWDSGNRSWQYIGTGNFGTPINAIIQDMNAAPGGDVRLTGPGGNNRRPEPDFFQLLKAGVLSGSIAKSSAEPTLAAPGYQAVEGDDDLQILRIGACLIDQADPDNFPTSVYLNIGGTPVSVHGVEDLPYLCSTMIGPRWVWSAAPPWTPLHTISYAMVWAPQIWLPHNPTTVAASSNGDENPAQVRIRIASGTLQKIDFSGTDYDVLNVNAPVALTALPITEIVINRSGYSNYRNEIRVPVEADVANAPAARLRNQIGSPGPWWTSPTAGNATGFVLDQKGAVPTTVAPGSSLFFPSLQLSGVVLVMEYLRGGQWFVYDSFAGSADLPGPTGISTSNLGLGILTENRFTNDLSGMHVMAKWDPRTNRWGPSHGWNLSNPMSPPVAGSNGIRRAEPFIQANPNGTAADDTPTLFGLWPQGHTDWNTAGMFTLVPGADNIFRPNDACKGDAANPFRNMTDAARRPVILQRPFRSVGEMGYAFRDTPWQTLNFFDATSGDAALLDLFCVSETPSNSAGRFNLNSAPAKVIEAVLSSAGKSSDGTSAVDSAALASNLISFRDAQPAKAFANKEALVRFVSSTQFSSADSSEVIKGRREAVVRGLADSAQTRTWNLLIDLIAQSGRFGSAADKLEKFTVKGERRYWLHLAIDRFTGEVIDSQLEPVAE